VAGTPLPFPPGCLVRVTGLGRFGVPFRELRAALEEPGEPVQFLDFPGSADGRLAREREEAAAAGATPTTATTTTTTTTATAGLGSPHRGASALVPAEASRLRARVGGAEAEDGADGAGAMDASGQGAAPPPSGGCDDGDDAAADAAAPLLPPDTAIVRFASAGAADAAARHFEQHGLRLAGRGPCAPAVVAAVERPSAAFERDYWAWLYRQRAGVARAGRVRAPGKRRRRHKRR